ncbi:MAG: hypothetical protein IJQ81_08115 [Oscillibacter sp.]|nr:hypothetical protein [Oscillibacter sp.]
MKPEYAIRAKALTVAEILREEGLTVSQGFEALERAKEICRIVLHDDTATENDGSVTD